MSGRALNHVYSWRVAAGADLLRLDELPALPKVPIAPFGFGKPSLIVLSSLPERCCSQLQASMVTFCLL